MWTPMPRTRVAERMDSPEIDPGAHQAALQGLARLNRLSGSARILWPALRDMARRAGRAVTVLDVATGSGDIPVRLARRARACALDIEWHACDVSERAITHAVARAAREGVRLTGHVTDATRDRLPGRFDAVTCSLFLHHLDEPEVVRALKAMADAAGRLLLVSDLRRTRAGLMLARIVPRLVTTSSIVHFDAAASVRAAYQPRELAALADRAGLAGSTLRHAWPERMLLTWTRQTA
ncbi:MAG: methyltransferase domain-containing protein [Phycisphaerae bacterium]|nr:methyltransferase domain-containing protein [Phycisphaerae bacterium]